MAQRPATVVVRDKNRKMEKITTIAMHKKAFSCVAVRGRPPGMRDDQA
jgi:hypothetical protein